MASISMALGTSSGLFTALGMVATGIAMLQWSSRGRPPHWLETAAFEIDMKKETAGDRTGESSHGLVRPFAGLRCPRFASTAPGWHNGGMAAEQASSEPEPRATFDYAPGRLAEALEFLKRTRSELRSLRMVRVWTDRLQVFDVNHDYFEVRGVGYGEVDIVPLLELVNTNFKPEQIHSPIAAPFKEFLTGRRYPWAHDRVL
jgi:hypothetical protein